jgi:ABC-type sulfate transport system permease subunit
MLNLSASCDNVSPCLTVYVEAASTIDDPATKTDATPATAKAVCLTLLINLILTPILETNFFIYAYP